jgi:transcriptional antiterminator RfaH
MFNAPHQHDADCAWFLLQTKPRMEESALANLENQGYQCFLPRLLRERVSRGRVKVTREPLFARYLFIRLGTTLDSVSWAPLRSTVGVSQLVRFGEQAAKASESLIDALRRAEDTQGAEGIEGTAGTEGTENIERLFKSGDPVTILDGPFQGINAIYQAHDAQQRAFVLIELLKKTTRLNIGIASLSGAR